MALHDTGNDASALQVGGDPVGDHGGKVGPGERERVAGHLLVSYGVGLSLRSARTVLENTMLTAALTDTSTKWNIVCISTWTEKQQGRDWVRCPATQPEVSGVDLAVETFSKLFLSPYPLPHMSRYLPACRPATV